MDDIESLTASLVREYLSRKVRSNDTIVSVSGVLVALVVIPAYAIDKIDNNR